MSVSGLLHFFWLVNRNLFHYCPRGPHSYILLGPLLDFLGLIEILVGVLHIYQALSFLPEPYPSTEAPPGAVGAPEPA